MSQTNLQEDPIEIAHQEVLEAAVARKALVTDIVNDIADGIMVLRVRDGMSIDRSQAMERARNVAARFILKYRIERMG